MALERKRLLTSDLVTFILIIVNQRLNYQVCHLKGSKEVWSVNSELEFSYQLVSLLHFRVALISSKTFRLLSASVLVFIGRIDVEAKTPILWPPHAKSWLFWKDPDAGKDWGQEEKGMTENEVVGWHHQLNGHGFGWTLGVGDGQGGLACCGSWGPKKLGTSEQLNWLTDWQ